MQITVGTEAVQVAHGGRTQLVIQNLGPGVVEFDTEGSVVFGEGLRLTVGAVYEFPTASADDDVWVVSDTADTDVRIVRVG